MFLPGWQHQGAPACPCSSQPHNAQVTFRFLACILQNFESSFPELLDWLQEKQNMGQSRSGMGMETRVTAEYRRKGFCCVATLYAEDSRKRLQDSPLPSGIHQHLAQLARCPPCLGTSCSIEGDWQL